MHTEALKTMLPPMPISDKEASNVGLVFDGDQNAVDDKWQCFLCDKPLAKHVRCIEKHFAMPPHFDVEQSELKKWLVYKDAITLQNSSNTEYHLKHLRLTKAIKAKEALGLNAGEPAAAEAAAPCPVVFPAPKPKWAAAPKSPPRGVDIAAALAPLQSEVRELASSMAKRGIEEPVPEMSITADARAWKPDVIRGERNDWELEPNAAVDLTDFEHYLQTRAGLVEKSKAAYTQKLRYFLGLFDLPDGFSHVGFAAGLFSTGIMEDLLALPIMQPSLPLTRSIMASVSHFCKFVLAKCDRLRLDEAARCIRLLQSDIFGPLRKLTSKHKKFGATRKGMRDSAKIKNFAPWDTVRTALKNGMIDMHTIAAMFGDQGLPWQLKRAINVIMTSLVYLNSFAGRPGEWESMERRVMENVVEAGVGLLTVEDHKTDYKYGTLGRYLPPGNMEAARHVLRCHPQGSELFLDPPKASTEHVSASDMIKKFCSVYLPNYQALTPTQLRKFFTSKLKRDTDNDLAFKMLCEIDGHTPQVADAHYVLPDPEADAAFAKDLFEKVVGEPVEWPSEGELQSERAASAARVQNGFFRRSRDGNAEDETGGETDGTAEDETEGDTGGETEGEAGGEAEGEAEGEAVRAEGKRKAEPSEPDRRTRRCGSSAAVGGSSAAAGGFSAAAGGSSAATGGSSATAALFEFCSDDQKNITKYMEIQRRGQKFDPLTENEVKYLVREFRTRYGEAASPPPNTFVDETILKGKGCVVKGLRKCVGKQQVRGFYRTFLSMARDID